MLSSNKSCQQGENITLPLHFFFQDVFAPRFAKNAQLTFYHLYKCAEEEKSKVIRVLNLWQKNAGTGIKKNEWQNLSGTVPVLDSMT